MDNKHSVFSFDLNESLYFEKGQEVAEIKNVSLDPEISIQPFSDYISIRGVVELKGEYERIVLSHDHHQDLPSLDDYHQAKRYVEEVIDIEGDISKFNHRIPVEISVPTYRVNNLEDVTVRIASFDYELPTPSQFRLMSTIEIYGVNSSHEDDQSATSNQEELLNEKFEFEIKNEEEKRDENIEESLTEEDSVEKLYKQNLEHEVEDQQKEEVQDEIVEEKNKNDNDAEDPRWKKKYSQTLAEFFEQSVSKESSSFQSPSVENNIHEDTFLSSESDYDDDVVESSSSRKQTNLRYLTDMFRDEEEDYTKMRLCIVQENDTLESIAKRYGTTSMHIANQNSLTDDTVIQGKLLHIPYPKK